MKWQRNLYKIGDNAAEPLEKQANLRGLDINKPESEIDSEFSHYK